MDQVRKPLRYSHYARSTKKHIASGFYDLSIFMGEREIEKFLSNLASAQNVASSPWECVGELLFWFSSRNWQEFKRSHRVNIASINFSPITHK
jgi:hypothetical protein